MRNQLQRWGLLCLCLLMSCFMKAQDVTASWDFENDIPKGIRESTNYQGTTADIPSDVEGVSMHVDATNGKLNCVGRNNAQFNKDTKLQVPVKSAKDIVAVKAYSDDHANFTVGGVAAASAEVEHKATAAEVAAGYVEVVATGGCYIYSVKVTFVSQVQEKELYSTDFTEWGEYETKAKQEVTTAEWNTKYSHETLTFSVYNTQIGASNLNTGKFPDWKGGMLMAAKSADPYIETSALKSITKVHFIHGATGGNRGWKLWAQGDGDTDWVLLSDAVANPAAGSEVTANVNRTNCKLKFTNITDNQNAYLMQLDIYGNVDMSGAPVLGTFSVNGKQYAAADIFEENAAGEMVATVEVSKKEAMVSEQNPLTDLTTDNGDITSTTYELLENGNALVTIVLNANGETVTYKLTVAFKPDYTLSYINTDGEVIGTQTVEKDAAITAFEDLEQKVTVADGKKFRGWFEEPDGGRKYTVEDVITGDASLYAVATDIETQSTSARYTFNLTDKYFYAEDHEAFNPENAAFHDSTHGWTLEPNGKIDLLVGGHAYIIATLCRYSKSDAVITLSDAQGNEVASVSGYSSTDGKTVSLEYKGGAGVLTLTASNEVYLHKLVIANVEDAPIEKNEQGYYVVRPGDAGHLLTTLEIANASSSSDARTYVFVPDGTYDLGSEVLTPINGTNVSVIGQSMDNTVIVNEAEVEGIGTSATFLVTGTGTYFQDLTLKNAYDYYKPGFAGRAVCLQDKGAHTICKNVRMLSYQDTYYSNGTSQYYFETSDIHGTVDFICGGGDVFFNGCTLTVEPRNADGTGECTLTAPSTNISSNKYGYVFSGCTIDSKAAKFNYGRAWNDNPRCAYINTTLLQPEKLNANRWTLGGMNVPADKFVEYNTMDETGKVVSPESLVLKFTKESTVNEYETILSKEQADGYSLENVFPTWTPAAYTVQKQMGALTVKDGVIKWAAVDGAPAYAVFNDGKFVAITGETSYTVTEGDASSYSVRAANEYGGFGPAVKADGTSGINSVETATGDVVRTAYYNLQGSRVSDTYKGVVIKVDTMKDGKQVATKLVRN